MGGEDTENTELWPTNYEESTQLQDFVHTMLGGGNAMRGECVGRGHTQLSRAGAWAEVVSGLGTKL